MTNTQVCPHCGLPLAEGATDGLCLRCLLESGLVETLTTERRLKASDEHVPAAWPDFGPYHTIGVLGEGGMGIVYLVEQREPVRRRVALKILKSGDAGSTVLARFESESQALALMDHPNIARVYDAGTTASGRPYFAMEYVPGIPITDYCDRNLLGFRERLTLFQQVCQGVHHAHQKGIIHRDLKPSNVLVMLQDGKPVPKVIDFGVAKAVNQRLVERTLFTEIGMLIGTPEYMSPEQADLTGLDVDSTTDIYSLGVLLYEMLVGALPFDSKTLRKAGYAEIQRVIRDTEPPKPSTRLSTMGHGAQEVARHRRSDVRTLVRLLRGDLEWITMKALEKDRTRRYASASEFAADIARHLDNEPVVAGPPTIGYRTKKFVRRHKGLVAAGAAVTASLLIGAVISFALYLKASLAQETAESESYAANLSAADVQLRAGQATDARFRLANTPPALRGWEWRYLMARTDESAATIYSRDFEGVDEEGSREISFSEDGAKLFTYGDDFLRSWDIATKHMVTDLSGLGMVLAIGAHGKTVLVGPPDQTVSDLPPEGFVLRLYDVGTRRLLSTLRGMTSEPGVSAISQDGTLVAAASGLFREENLGHPATITIWDAVSGQITARLNGHTDWVESLSFSPDGKLLATSSLDRTVRVWNLTSHGTPAVLKHEVRASRVAFSNDGRLLASGSDDGKVRLWNPASGLTLRTWQATLAGGVRAIAFSPDGSLLATCSSGENVRIWEVASGLLRNEFTGRRVRAVAFHPTLPRLYTAGAGVIKEWDLASGGAVIRNGEPYRVAFSPDGRYMATGSEDGGVRIHDGVSGNFLRSLVGHTKTVIAVAFSPDSKLVASGGADNTIKIWTVLDGRLIRTLTGHTKWIWAIAFSPDGSRIVSSSEDQSIRIWDLGSKAPPGIISTTSPLSQIALSPDGRTILALRKWDKSISLWDASTKQNSGTLNTDTPETSPSFPRGMALSQDGAVLIGPADSGHAIAIWDFPRRRLRQILPVFHGGDALSSLAISPDGSRVAVGGSNSGTLSIWDLRRGKLLATLGGHTGIVYSLAWSPDGTRLVSSGDQTIRIWNSRSLYNYDAELLLDKVSERSLLVDEMVLELKGNREITAELRRDAIQLATSRGNASYSDLIEAAWKIGVASNRSGEEYMQGLRRATVAAQVAPWFSYTNITLGLLQYRNGEFDQALLSAQRAMEIQKSRGPDAHAIRAMAYSRLHDPGRAQSEASMGRKAADQSKVNEDHKLLEEAESLISRKQL